MKTVYIHAIIGIWRPGSYVWNLAACRCTVLLLLMYQRMLVYVTDWQVTKFTFALQNVAGLGNYGIASDTTLSKRSTIICIFMARSSICIYRASKLVRYYWGFPFNCLGAARCCRCFATWSHPSMELPSIAGHGDVPLAPEESFREQRQMQRGKH